MSDENVIPFRTPFPGQNIKSAEEVKAELSDLRSEQDEMDELRALQEKVELPHLHGWKWYKWAAAFRDSTNPVNLLCAANQSSKSSTQIRKSILWATDQKLWPSLWRQKPVQFWYLYPSQSVVNAEWDTKWALFMPKGEMKDDPYYGWEVMKKGGDIKGIKWKSGVYLYFKTYTQNPKVLQAGSCDAIFCDEELPIQVGDKNLFDELMQRVSATDGYFHMVFTATLGQQEWRRAMDPTEEEVTNGKEFLPQAFKQTVSLYECMTYEDGTASHWSLEKIKVREARCSTHNEVLKRIWGKFILIGGRKYESFDIKRHLKKKHMIPSNWFIYGGADIGSGGPDGHPSALCYVAVAPNFRSGRVFLGWRGDDERTTAGDVVQKHISLVKSEKLTMTAQHYDWGNADFGEIATRMSVPFEKADKSHEKGEEVLNTLFKNDMLFIYEDAELMKLAGELASLKKDGAKKHAKDDFTDALRYCVTKIPWDWTAITGEASILDEQPEEVLTPLQQEIKARRQAFEDENQAEEQRIQDEFDEWNERY